MQEKSKEELEAEQEIINFKKEENNKKIKDVKESLNTRNNIVSLHSDSEFATAYFIIFSDFLNVFKNEIERIKFSIKKEKLEEYEKIRDDLVKEGKLNKKMFKNSSSSLTDGEQDKLIKFSDSISSNEENVLSPIIIDMLESSHKLLEVAKNTNLSTLLNKNILDVVEESATTKIKDESINVVKNTMKDIISNKNKLRVR